MYISENINSEDNNILDQREKQNNSNPLNSQEKNQINNNNNCQADEENHLKCNCGHEHHRYPGNIGRNFICLKRYVFGPLLDILYWLFCHIANIGGWLIWLYSSGDFYPKKVYYPLNILCVLAEYYLIMSYITEPGIIPRKCPEYAIKEIESSDNNNEDNSEKKKRLEIPSIFLKIKCHTCQIMRPPEASHCSICDNCVMGFDHHCTFISNCVGKRNRKYFVLFLFYGGIFALIATCLNVRIIYYVFITKFKETLLVIWKNNPFLLILDIILFIIFLQATCRPEELIFQLIFGGLTWFGLFWVIWSKNIERGKVPSYYTPLLFITFIIGISLTLFIISNLVIQIYQISRRLTIKQDYAIKIKLNENELHNRSNEALKEYIKPYSLKEKIYNIFEFIFAKIDDSLIIPERDLVENSS